MVTCFIWCDQQFAGIQSSNTGYIIVYRLAFWPITMRMTYDTTNTPLGCWLQRMLQRLFGPMAWCLVHTRENEDPSVPSSFVSFGAHTHTCVAWFCFHTIEGTKRHDDVTVRTMRVLGTTCKRHGIFTYKHAGVSTGLFTPRTQCVCYQHTMGRKKR